MGKSFKGVKDAQQIFGGAARLLYSDGTAAKPATVADIIDTSNGDLTSGWMEYGATDGGLALKRSYEMEEWEVDQVKGAIDTDITKWDNKIETSLAENSYNNLQQAWAGGEVTTDANGNKRMGIGAPDSVPEQMVAFLVERKGVVRAYVYWRAQWDGSESSTEFKKGEKTLIGINFNLLADPTETTDVFGAVLEEPQA